MCKKERHNLTTTSNLDYGIVATSSAAANTLACARMAPYGCQALNPVVGPLVHLKIRVHEAHTFTKATEVHAWCVEHAVYQAAVAVLESFGCFLLPLLSVASRIKWTSPFVHEPYSALSDKT